MARAYDDRQIEELKRNVSLLHVCAARGIELKRHGMREYIARCPLPEHTDEKPSFIVSPHKNLWHCMGCNTGGSVVDLVMRLDGLSFRDAIDKLLASTGLITHGSALLSPPT